ncbi:MAG: hypothetical protein IJ679_04265, partial [Lachnospiraceae bacterium]|nr:hypothetical protein [Lachnospiraceae bacterium]
FSTEVFSEAKEQGFDVEDMESNEIITVLDKIKKHLAMGGKDISAMGGLSDEEIAAMTGGSERMKAMLSSALEKAALPLEEDILSDGVQALQKFSELGQKEELAPAAMEYLLKNELEPTIEHVYQGTFSQGSVGSFEMPVEEETIEALMPQVEKLLDTVDLPLDDRQRENTQWMLEKNLPITAENLSYLNELQTRELYLDEDLALSAIVHSVEEGKRPQEAYVVAGFSLEDQAKDAADVLVQVSEEQVARVAERGDRISIDNLRREMLREERGLRPLESAKSDQVEAETESPEEPVKVEMVETESAEEPVKAGKETAMPSSSLAEVRAQRILQEARLVMSAQANLALLKQGISIDIQELSDVVDRLKDLEQSFYKTQLVEPGQAVSEEELFSRIDLFETTNREVEELSQMPAALLGQVPRLTNATISELHTAGREIAAVYKQADERYETMRTQIRRDLGDSRAKAFSNIDPILEDLHLETTAANRRAVRILGYNEQEISVESIAAVKANDALVQRTFKNLTPGAIAKLIQQGENPLHLSLEELNKKVDAIKAESGSESDEGRFAEFLFKAEQTGALSEEEREAFIGLHRLIYQVEKTDGALIGQLLAQGAEITLGNLMMALRTRKAQNREYTIDDQSGFGEIERTSLSITDQIEMAFQTERMRDAGELLTPQRFQQVGEEADWQQMSPDRFAEVLEEMPENPEEERMAKEYNRVLVQDMREAVKAEESVYDFLSRFDLAQTPANLEAFSQMLANRNDMYRRLFKDNDRRVFGTEADGVAEGEVGLSDVMEDLIREFGESVRTPEEMAKAQQHLQEVAENVMRNMIVEQPVGTIDVRGMQITIKQIKSLGQIARRTETYSMPIVVEDSVGNLSLRIIRADEEERGQVRLSFDMENTGVVDATFRCEADGVYGRITTSISATRQRLEERMEEIAASIAEVSGREVSLSFDLDARADANRIFDEAQTDFEPRTDGERPEVQTRVLYGIARRFIDSLGRLGGEG